MPVSTRPPARWLVTLERTPKVGVWQSAKTLQDERSSMRNLSADDGFGLPEIDGEMDGVDVQGVEVDDVDVGEIAVNGLDAGFDFLEEVDQPVEPSGEGMTEQDVTEFRARWADIQASFIDDPHRACEQADNLVDIVLQRLTERFARERNDLVRAWDRGNERTDTEDLRLAIKGYRGLVDRLLTAEL